MSLKKHGWIVISSYIQHVNIHNRSKFHFCNNIVCQSVIKLDHNLQENSVYLEHLREKINSFYEVPISCVYMSIS